MKRQPPLLRRARLLLPCLGLLLGALAILTWLDNAANRGITYQPTPPPIAWADVPQVGVNLYNIQFEPDPAAVTRTLELARAMGAHFVRLQVPWDDIEIHGKGDFEDRRNQPARSAWQKYDILFAEIARLGLEPIVRIDRAPDWARPNTLATSAWQAGYTFNRNSTGPPDKYADYAEFVAIFIERYRTSVRFVQFWNEPNLSYEWNWQTPQPGQFVELLRAASTAARAANPAVVVLFPSLAPTDGLDPQAPMSELEYLDQIYAAGGAQYFDIMSAQAYGLGQPPDEHRYVRPRRPGVDWVWQRPLDTRIDVSRLPLLREVMERHGDTRKSIWISEFGYVRELASVPAERRNAWGPPVSAEQQATYTVQQLERARREWPWVGVMNAWFLRWGGYLEPDPLDPTPGFALVTRDFQPLPAYTALQRYATAAPVMGVGAHTWGHPAVTQGPDGSWQVQWSGTSLAIVLRAPATVRLNTQPVAQINPDVEGGAVLIAENLADTTHTLTINSATAPAMLLVGRAPPWPWLWPLAFACTLLALASVGALLGLSLWP